MLRIAAGLALLGGVAGLLGYLTWIGRGPFAAAESRHLRAMKERTAVPVQVVPYRFSDFAALPHARPLAEYAPLEQGAVSLEGCVQLMIRSMDGDFHLEIAPVTRPQGPPVPRAVTAEITPEWHRNSTRWRWEKLSARFRPYNWTDPPWPGGPRRVRVSGWLLYDFEYDAPYRTARPAITPGPRGHRLTGWEIHPVTRLELWDDSLGRYVEVPR